jgi:hypothetical protein
MTALAAISSTLEIFLARVIRMVGSQASPLVVFSSARNFAVAGASFGGD